MTPKISTPFLASLMMVGMCFPIIAEAQLAPEPQTGSRFAKAAEQIEQTKLRIMMKDMARCVFSKQPNLVRKLLQSSDVGGVDFERLGVSEPNLIKRFPLSTCLVRSMDDQVSTAQLNLNTTTLRSVLAEEVYLSEYNTPIEIPDGQSETLANRYFTPSDNNAKSAAFGAFTDCVVYKSPQDADAVLRTRPGSEQEKTAVRALIPALSACIIKDQEVTLTEAGIRTIVADGLWSRSHYGSMAICDSTAVGTPAED